MRNKKVKLLRKLVYADRDYRKRRYNKFPNGQIKNTADMLSLDKQHVSARRFFRFLKDQTKYVKLSKLKSLIKEKQK